MGIQKNGIMGTFYNKTGAVIGRRYRGINMITGRHRSGKRKFTTSQLEHQYKVGLLTATLNYFPTQIGQGFKNYSKGRIAMNVAFSYNFGHAFIVTPEPEVVVVETGPSLPVAEGLDVEQTDEEKISAWEQVAARITLDFPKLVLSRGDIYPPNCAELMVSDDASFTCSWLASPQSEFNRATDMVCLAVWNATENTSWHYRNCTQRGNLTFTDAFAPGSADNVLHCYLYCVSANGKQIGDSEYVQLKR